MELGDSGEETEADDDLMELHAHTLSSTGNLESHSTDDLEIRANFEKMQAFKGDETFCAISDGGADSCVLGENAHVIEETGRFATLVGYDPRTTQIFQSSHCDCIPQSPNTGGNPSVFEDQ